MSNWIKYEQRAKCQKFICKFCGNIVMYISGLKVNECGYPFCPYCKAEMNVNEQKKGAQNE